LPREKLAAIKQRKTDDDASVQDEWMAALSICHPRV
jgi:hypothetical protein